MQERPCTLRHKNMQLTVLNPHHPEQDFPPLNKALREPDGLLAIGGGNAVGASIGAAIAQSFAGLLWVLINKRGSVAKFFRSRDNLQFLVTG